jgi:hypothetical protein
MEYEFVAEDGKRYMGSDAAPHSTPEAGDYNAFRSVQYQYPCKHYRLHY